MALKYDTVIFDLDGTLLNTLDDLADSMNAALLQCGLPQHTRDEIRGFVGNGITLLVKRSLAPVCDEATFQKAFSAFSAIYAKNMKNKTCPYSGIPEVLALFKENKVGMAVVSNKHQQAVAPLIKDYFGEYIGLAVGADETTPTKPDPTGTLKAISKLGSKRERAIYVGDSDVDIATAKNAGVLSVGCTWGFRGREVLIKAGADVIIDSPDELPAVLGL